jgi:hypothetical protein
MPTDFAALFNFRHECTGSHLFIRASVPRCRAQKNRSRPSEPQVGSRRPGSVSRSLSSPLDSRSTTCDTLSAALGCTLRRGPARSGPQPVWHNPLDSKEPAGMFSRTFRELQRRDRPWTPPWFTVSDRHKHQTGTNTIRAPQIVVPMGIGRCPRAQNPPLFCPTSDTA